MKQKFLFSALLLQITVSYAQFSLGPYLKGLANIKDTYIETGVDIPIGDHWGITPYFRLPLSNKEKSLLVLDRNTAAWNFVTLVQYEIDKTQAATGSPLRLWNIALQGEWGHNVFKYYPTGNKDDEEKSTKNTISGEFKLSYYYGEQNPTSGNPQSNFQVRLRYSNQYEAEKAVGVVNPANPGGVVTTTDMIISPPTKKPGFSPAIAFQRYKGQGEITFTHALFYDTKGPKNGDDPFSNSHRARYEFWLFYYPAVTGNPNFKLGVGPFLSLRTKGTDDLNEFEYGAQITVKLGSLFQSFF